MWKAFDEAGLMFYPLRSNAHVFIGANHPLADKDVITLDDLEPYPRYSFEQGVENSTSTSPKSPSATCPTRRTSAFPTAAP